MESPGGSPAPPPVDAAEVAAIAPRPRGWWITEAAAALGLLAAIGASVGLAAWIWRSNPDRVASYVRDNAIPRSARIYVLVNLIAGAGIACLLGLGLMRLGRRDLSWLARVGRRFSPLVLTAFLALLLRLRPWVGRDLEFLSLATVFGLSLQALMRLSLAAADPPFAPVPGGRLDRARAVLVGAFSSVRARLAGRALPLGIVLAGAACYAAYFGYLTIAAHHNLQSAAYDLGIEDNLVWNALHGARLFTTTPHDAGPSGSHLGFHQTYLAYLLALVYAIRQQPETLLGIQAVLVGFAAWPLYLLAARRLGRGPAVLIAFLYLFYAPVHGANLYDFHYPPLAPFFMWFTLYFVEEKRRVPAVIFAVLVLSVREDVAGTLGVLGAYLIFTRRAPRAGAAMAAAGLACFVTIKMVVMPWALGGSSAYVHQYKNLIPPGMGGFGGVLATVLGNPAYTVHTLLERDKLVYLLQIMSPLCFLPWRRPIGLLLSLPGFFFTVLETEYPPMIQMSFQYTAFWTTFLFIAVIENLDRAGHDRFVGEGGGAIRRRAWLAALAGAMLVTSYQHGAVLQRHTARAGFGPFTFGASPPDRERLETLRRLIARVPPDARIVSSENVVPQVSSRAFSYSLRNGIWDADYLLFALPARDNERKAARDALISRTFGVVESTGKFVLARRGEKTDLNNSVVDLLKD